MSKDIWHNADKKPMLHTEIILCGDGWSMAMGIIPETVNNICWKNVEKWCYIDDLIKENERTRKALEITTDAIDEILVLDSGKFIQEPAEMWKIAKSAKDQIIALEQKDVK